MGCLEVALLTREGDEDDTFEMDSCDLWRASSEDLTVWECALFPVDTFAASDLDERTFTSDFRFRTSLSVNGPSSCRNTLSVPEIAPVDGSSLHSNSPSLLIISWRNSTSSSWSCRSAIIQRAVKGLASARVKRDKKLVCDVNYESTLAKNQRYTHVLRSFKISHFLHIKNNHILAFTLNSLTVATETQSCEKLCSI